MKILSERSVFKYLPIQMQGEQLLIFDAIRMAFEMIEYNYQSLEEILHELSQDDTIKKNIPQAFNYAWGVIDHTSRLIKLFEKLPSETNHASLNNIRQVNAFRNTIQHLHERIDESMLKNRSAFYGMLIWYHNNTTTGKVTPFTIISGIHFGGEVTFTIPDLSQSKLEVNDITIQTVDKTKTIVINLSKIMLELKILCETNETKISAFFQEQGWELCDWSKRQDIIIRINSEDGIETEN